jgi:hypothetical protein
MLAGAGTTSSIYMQNSYAINPPSAIAFDRLEGCRLYLAYLRDAKLAGNFDPDDGSMIVKPLCLSSGSLNHRSGVWISGVSLRKI